jgi:hypothetical protein
MNNTMDKQIIINNSLLRQNNQLLAKLEEKKDIVQRRNTELQIHNKEILTKLVEKNNITPQNYLETKKTTTLIREIFLLSIFFFSMLWIFQKLPF